MRKNLLGIVLLLGFIISMQAQTVQESKTSDNWYIGLNAGTSAKTTHVRTFKNLNPTAGIRLGRNLTPVFGWAVDGQFYMGDKGFYNGNKLNTAITGVNTSLLGILNFSNLFGGYNGQPRTFDIVGIAGIGWGHIFGHSLITDPTKEKTPIDRNFMTSKVGVDFTWNVGSEKALQLYVEPSVTYNLNEETQWNLNRSAIGVSAGLVYKFNNSNGTHNFALAKLYDQAEVDALNAEINRLRNQPTKTEIVIKEVEKEVEKPVYSGDVVVITFAQSKYNLTNEAKEALNQINSDASVAIKATASPEGSKKYNKKLSENRAKSVKDYLEARGVNVKSAKGLGVTGEASNRVAIVTIE